MQCVRQTNDTDRDLGLRDVLFRARGPGPGQPSQRSRHLEALSSRSSIDSLTLRLADGSTSSGLTFTVRVRRSTVASGLGGCRGYPSIAFREAGGITMFIGSFSRPFPGFGMRPEVVVAYEVAEYTTTSMQPNRPKEHAAVQQSLRGCHFGDRWRKSCPNPRGCPPASVVALFAAIAEHLIGHPAALADIYSEFERGRTDRAGTGDDCGWRRHRRGPKLKEPAAHTFGSCPRQPSSTSSAGTRTHGSVARSGRTSLPNLRDRRGRRQGDARRARHEVHALP